MFNHGSLFSGIGGFDLAAEWMGWNNVFHCELNEFGQKILKYYWPNAISYGDIKQTDFTIHIGNIDILTGGFPCQPFSLAGKRKGTEDDRHLWPEMLRVIREVRPTWIVGENVFGIINWNRGLVFDQVQSDLEAERYEVQPYVLPACAVNAPHRRDRTWFVAYNNKSDGNISRFYTGKISQFEASGVFKNTFTNTISPGLQRNERRETHEERNRTKTFRPATEQIEIPTWDRWPTQPPVCSRDDGIYTELDGITFSKWRNESIKAYGNAIVPQIALQIFKVISFMDNSKK